MADSDPSTAVDAASPSLSADAAAPAPSPASPPAEERGRSVELAALFDSLELLWNRAGSLDLVTLRPRIEVEGEMVKAARLQAFKDGRFREA